MIADRELRKLFEGESAEHLACLDDGLLRLEKTPADPALLEEVFRESHSLKGAARMLGLVRVESTAHELESVFNAARKRETPLTPQVIEQMNTVLGNLRQRVREALDTNTQSSTSPLTETPPAATMGETIAAAPPLAIADTESLTSPPDTPPSDTPQAVIPEIPSSTPFRIDTVRVETRKLDDLLTQSGELSVIQGRSQHHLALLDALLEQWTALERDRRKRNAGPSGRQGAEGVAPQRFGGLLKQACDAFFNDNARLASTVHLLEDQVNDIRLLPLSTLFALFPRMLRDLSKAQGKEVELVIEGGDISVDKRILQEMKDPLMHLIRNAIDHGIEPPGERELRGKPHCARVGLHAVRENANLLLTVRDDGRGLDIATIRRRAKQHGLIDEATLAAMTPAQLQQLIFMPGFSTSSFVTELSGRGVGLDVVRVNVELMKGSIHLQSTAGQGLSVQLRLPLNLTTTQLLLASVGGGHYGLPVEFIQTSRRVRKDEIFTLEGRLAIRLDGQPVMAARLVDLLELPGGKAPAPDIQACIVIQVGDERLGLLADDLLAEEEVVPKPLGPPLRRVRNIAALCMLGSGEICAVLNPADLLRSAHKSGVATSSEAQTTLREAARPVVLLAEDSALIRAMEKRILEDGGYEVVATVDGMDALNALGNRAFDAVVSDVMMPNMDGLTLTARIRAQPRYKELPVILVTSLASDEDKRRGLDAGANAYIPKPAFDQRVLLETLKRVIVTPDFGRRVAK